MRPRGSHVVGSAAGWLGRVRVTSGRLAASDGVGPARTMPGCVFEPGPVRPSSLAWPWSWAEGRPCPPPRNRLRPGSPAAARSQAATQPATATAPIVKPCAKDMAEGFECVTLTVPLDHFHDTGKTTQVTFAIKRHTAKGPGKGVFVTATGGPGTSGIQSAVDYRDAFAESVQQDYDVVFFDQRGAHLSGDLTCPNAATVFYRTNSTPAESTATTGLGADSHTFVDDCLAESKADPTCCRTTRPRSRRRRTSSRSGSYLGADRSSSTARAMARSWSRHTPRRIRTASRDCSWTARST